MTIITGNQAQAARARIYHLSNKETLSGKEMKELTALCDALEKYESITSEIAQVYKEE